MIILVVSIILALIAIHPVPGVDGIAIRSVVKNSAAADAGIVSPSPTSSPMSREVIISINNKPITSEEDFYVLEQDLDINQTITIKTTKGFYRLETKALTEEITLNETEIVEINETFEVEKEINGTTVMISETRLRNITRNKTQTNIIGVQKLGLSVYPAPNNNIRRGLDLQGGTRVVLKPESEVSDEDMELLLENMKERLNVFGLSDVIVRKTKDLSGRQYILVEIAGANDDEVRNLLARQGKFEAKIGNDTIFRGGQDITYVCRSADCSGIDPFAGCQPGTGGISCRFRFSISLTPEAAQVQADRTANIRVITENNDQYLAEPLDLYLDNELVDSLNIGADLRGRAVTEIAISGSGSGPAREAAVTDSLRNMKRLQTILITGSLPVKLEIVKTDAISPLLGREFLNNAILIGILAILSVAGMVFLRYRTLAVALPIVITMTSEILLMLGLAALIGWNLDLAAIAGIIIAAGTGVDDQIVIVDEIMRGEASSSNWRERFKRAFFIIFSAYFATVVAMVPLLFAGAGLLKGFAFVTIAGVSFGVFITRPAYAAIVEILLRR